MAYFKNGAAGLGGTGKTFPVRKGAAGIQVRCHLVNFPNRISGGTTYPSLKLRVRCTMTLSSTPHGRFRAAHPPRPFPGTSCPARGEKRSRTGACSRPLPCDGVRAPRRRISLTKGLLWAPVQPGDEIILMASSHLAFLLLQLFLLLLRRCSCLRETLNWGRRDFGSCLPMPPALSVMVGPPLRLVTQARQTLAVLCGHVWISGQAFLFGQMHGSGRNSRR